MPIRKTLPRFSKASWATLCRRAAPLPRGHPGATSLLPCPLTVEIKRGWWGRNRTASLGEQRGTPALAELARAKAAPHGHRGGSRLWRALYPPAPASLRVACLGTPPQHRNPVKGDPTSDVGREQSKRRRNDDSEQRQKWQNDDDSKAEGRGDPRTGHTQGATGPGPLPAPRWGLFLGAGRPVNELTKKSNKLLRG